MLLSSKTISNQIKQQWNGRRKGVSDLYSGIHNFIEIREGSMINASMLKE